MEAKTPIALVQQGTTSKHRVITGVLGTFPQQVEEEGRREAIHAPTLIIIGGVVSLHDTLEWFRP